MAKRIDVSLELGVHVMEKLVLLILIQIILISCKVTEQPEFIEVKSLDVIDTSLNNFTVEALLIFENKNQVGGTLQANDIHVFVDSIDVATIQSELFKVPKQSEFTIPLKAVIPFEKVFNDNKQNLFDKILNVIANKKVQLLYRGEVRYKLGAFHYDYPIDIMQEINLKN